jgi:hypothetical protein
VKPHLHNVNASAMLATSMLANNNRHPNDAKTDMQKTKDSVFTFAMTRLHTVRRIIPVLSVQQFESFIMDRLLLDLLTVPCVRLAYHPK